LGGFDELSGNKQIKSELSGLLSHNKTSHAYIIEGPTGSGKKILSRLIAKSLMCRGSNKPCGLCSHCKKIENNIHPDLKILSPNEKNTISVDIIKELCRDMYIRPNEGEYKIYIIENAQDMTRQAQNALLKVFEEPPEYGVIILTVTNSKALLLTILSRGLLFSMCPLSKDEIFDILNKKYGGKGNSDEKLELAALLGGGFIGRTEKLLKDESFDAAIEFRRKFFGAIQKKDKTAFLALHTALDNKRPEYAIIIDIIGITLREIISFLSNEKKTYSPLVSEMSKFLNTKQAVSLYRILCELYRCGEKNVNFGLASYTALLHCWEEIN
jgi:DNA polymerase-3 subunit delta'